MRAASAASGSPDPVTPLPRATIPLPRAVPETIESPLATFRTTPQAADAADAAARLAPTSTLWDLVERFKTMFKKLPRQVKTFDPDGFVRDINAHIETAGLRPEGGREQEPGVAIVNVISRPAYDKTRFAVDPKGFE